MKNKFEGGRDYKRVEIGVTSKSLVMKNKLWVERREIEGGGCKRVEMGVTSIIDIMNDTP